MQLMRYVNEMSKFYCVFGALTAFVFCSVAGYPRHGDVNGGEVARQYRTDVEKYLNVHFQNKIGNYNPEMVKFYLYTKQQPDKVELKRENFLHYLKNSTYDVARRTKIFIHDHLFFESYYKELITAYLRHHHEPVNVITVDYSYYSGAEHEEFVMRVYREIGASVAELLEKLNHYGVTGDKIHIIGHGMGAHIGAVVAHKLTTFKVDRITGLDPVGLKFDEDKSLPQLQKHHANFVDVIVTNAKGIGTKDRTRGHVNFYPNGGDVQPQSEMLMSHLKSYFYYVESISRGKVFQAYVADSYENFKAGKYDQVKVNHMGEYVSKNEVGDFYLDTNPISPYSLSTDSNFHFETTKFDEMYLNFILGTKLGPFAFAPKDDPHFAKAGINKETLYEGFVEGREPHNIEGKENHPQP